MSKATKLRKSNAKAEAPVETTPVVALVAPPAPAVEPAKVEVIEAPKRPSQPIVQNASQGRARRASRADATATLGSVAVNVGRDGQISVKTQGFLSLGLACGVTEVQRFKGLASRTEALAMVVRAGLDAMGIGAELSAEDYASALKAAAHARATAPVSPSAQARAAAKPVKPALERL